MFFASIINITIDSISIPQWRVCVISIFILSRTYWVEEKKKRKDTLHKNASRLRFFSRSAIFHSSIARLLCTCIHLPSIKLDDTSHRLMKWVLFKLLQLLLKQICHSIFTLGLNKQRLSFASILSFTFPLMALKDFDVNILSFFVFNYALQILMETSK